MKKLKTFALSGLALAAAVVSSAPAMAVDVSGAVTEITSAGADINTLGEAILAVVVIVMVISFVRRALSKL